jgi:ATP-binding cassette subfamily B multidrug efflux pump
MNGERPVPRTAGSGHGRGPMGGGHRMGMPVDKAKDFRGTLRRLLAYLQPHRLRLLVVLTAAILGTIFSIVIPRILGTATTELFEGTMLKMRGVPGAAIDFDFITRILITLAFLYSLSFLFSYAQQLIMAGVSQKIVYQMRKDVDDKLARLPLKFYDGQPHGEILSRVTNDIDIISSTLQQSITQLITAIISMVGVVVMMLIISPFLTLIAMVTLPLSLFVTVSIAKRSQRYFARQQKELGILNGHVEEMYGGHSIVKAFGREREAVLQFNKINERLYEAGWQAQFISGIIMPLMFFIGNIGYVLISVAGGIMVAQRSVTIGDMQAFLQYSRHFTQPITQIASIANIIQSTVAAAERVFAILDEAEEIPDCTDPVTISRPDGEVRFERVRFAYKAGVPLLEDLNLEVRKGQAVAIVGPTGAGKTTLVNLLMRFYEIAGGKITIDGVDIRELRRGDLRSMFGMVLQDTWLFNGTIWDNIAYGREGATEAEVVSAARAAYADHFIRTLPEGYNTILNEEASNISQGQKQLLTIARAIIADPAILILDEATSSVDTRTEVHIQKGMTALRQGRTSFIIAHRLSTTRSADLILVMNNGGVVEKGTHEELLALNGFYADLYSSQFKGANLNNEAV